jgi:quinol monooxygenase YgiN
VSENVSEKKISVVATFKAKAGMAEAVREAVLALVAPTRAEAGCINYDLHQSMDDPTVFILYENWVSKADLDAHLEMPHLKQILARADEVLRAPVEIVLCEMISEPAG